MKRTLFKWIKRAGIYCMTTFDDKGKQTQEWLLGIKKGELEDWLAKEKGSNDT